MASESIQTFSAPTMHEALARVRESLGPDAVILHTRQATTKGIFGKKGHQVEITASQGVVRAAEQTRDVRPPASNSERTKPTPATSSLEDQVRRLQRLVDRMSGLPATSEGRTRAPSELQEYLELLEFPSGLIRECLEVAGTDPQRRLSPDDEELIDMLVGYLASRLRTTPCLEDPQLVSALALVGPTGVGKTTTVARLASHALDLGRPVQLATIDEYRVGAVDEIRRYAEIFGIPWTTARTPAELRRWLERQPRGSLTIIDTPGRAAVEEKEIAELAHFLERGISKALVLSANIRESSARASLDAFRSLDYERLILTKLDETPGTGAVAGLASMSPAPVSYLCLGQNIRGDLQPADSRRLARWAMGEAARRPAEPVVVET
jgi:flagellar biosynthesis protein FlhF